MLFIALFGIENKNKHLGVINNIICRSCGRLTSYEINKSFTCFHIFFISVFRWNVKYFVRTNCCGCLYELDPDVGRAFEKNPDTEIKKENLRFMKLPFKYCPNCEAEVPEEFSYCPYCGGRL